MNQKKIARWLKAKELYTQGRQTEQGLKYPTYDEIADEVGLKAQTIRLKSSRENWTLLRKQMIAKVENLTAERKSTVMAGESVEFDSVCLSQARKLLEKAERGIESGEPLDKMATVIEKAQKVGRLAFGEMEPDKPVTIKVEYDK